MAIKDHKNPAGKDLALHFNVITNVLDGKDQFQAELLITNESAFVLKGNWSIYFNFLRFIIPDSVSDGFQIRHINGDYFCLEPSVDFTPLLSKSKVTIGFIGSFWAIKKIDAPVGFYIVYKDEAGNELSPESIPALSIGDFTHPEQVTRSANDLMQIPTSESRYEKSREVFLLPKETLTPIMPSPAFYERKQGTFPIKSTAIIAYQAGLYSEALHLSEFLGRYLGRALALLEGTQGDIRMSTGKIIVSGQQEISNSESYTMRVDASGIDIIGAGAAGVFYATQSLIQLINRTENDDDPIGEVPHILVQDKPQFAYRGMHLDVARNFHGDKTVQKLMDMMSFYKLNKFHFHLTDDEGWRIEIPGLPELTGVGAHRGHTLSESECLLPSYGSGSDPEDPTSSGNGFYSRQEFIGLLGYAATRHIEVIPAIDFPGHARAAVRAMEVRYDHFKSIDDMVKANEYLLTDWNDTSEYESVQLWKRNVVNIGLDSTYRFIEKVVDELMGMYAEAGVELSTIHVGGDEVPHGAWLNSPVCHDLMEAQPALQDVHDLTEYFIGRVNDILTSRGLITAGWEEIALSHKNGQAEPNPALVKRQLTPYTWNTIWGDGGEENPYKLANLGYKVVLSNATNLYFDLSYDKDPEEAGYYWAGYTDTEDTFKFLPMDYYQCAEKDVLGNPIDYRSRYKTATRLTQKGRNNIQGIQGQLWGETIRTADRIEYLLFPRMCALAERAWSLEPEWANINQVKHREESYKRDWNEFANRLGQIELPRLDHLFDGIQYRIPLPGAKLINGHLMANMPFPGLTIRYTTDGSEPTETSSIFEQSIPIDRQLVKLKIFSANGRSSRTSIKNSHS